MSSSGRPSQSALAHFVVRPVAELLEQLPCDQHRRAHSPGEFRNRHRGARRRVLRRDASQHVCRDRRLIAELDECTFDRAIIQHSGNAGTQRSAHATLPLIVLNQLNGGTGKGDFNGRAVSSDDDNNRLTAGGDRGVDDTANERPAGDGRQLFRPTETGGAAGGEDDRAYARHAGNGLRCGRLA
ncbi:MAG: hypothetical protein QM754_13820 [Tepidisphaeraceae bacterium]